MVAREETALLFRIVAILLEYPVGKLLDGLDDVRESLDGISDSSQRSACLDFLEYFWKTPLIDLQEHYTETFDLEPATSLNLTFHKWGDGRERGRILAHLIALYKESGYELAAKELPDYLPVMLEYVSLCPEHAPYFLDSYGLCLLALERRLRERRSPYAGLLRVIHSGLERLRPEGA